ncbi:fumarylacetoacetate hydrolase family protein [Aspergillus pseudodeflectus]|uniref:Fumarylacetoacetate hydrolase family protein n=1 Tax=Aspergillus pseudodeflectus TaxID=176178 RepID=A0ABR4JZ82_9EURO
MAAVFNRLLRFRDTGGKIHYGETDDLSDWKGKQIPVYSGEVPWDLSPTNEKAEVAEVLCPLPSVPLFYGIGLNYKRHIEEAGFPVPKHPVVFIKPPDALAGPFEDIHIDRRCLDMDYEGELCVIIGKDCKNFRIGDDPLEFVLGYTVGNDVSSRFWQMPPQSGHQHGYAKSFDKFGPIGPLIVSPHIEPMQSGMVDGIPDLSLRVLVNGEERQNSRTSDLLFTLSDLLEHLSRGTTIRKGTIIMTGTPSGVAAFLDPPQWLQSGDVVEVDIEGLGSIRNKIIIE